jgi:predicted ATPase
VNGRSVEVGGRRLPFVGRVDELAELESWWDRTRGGVRQVVFVAGEAGAGKTTLVDVFLDEVRQDGLVLIGRGRCAEQLSEGEPYLPVLDVLGGWCRGPDARHVRDVLDSAAPTWLLQLPSALPPTDVESLRLRTAGTSTARMLREALDALADLAAWRPVLLVLEDMHYGDHSTTDLLAYLARREGPARLLVVVTYRPADVVARGHALGQVVRDLRARGECQFLPLELLSEAAIEEYLVRRLTPGRPSAALVAEVYERTGGNALFVQTLADHLIDHNLLGVDNGVVHGRERLDQLGIPESARLFIERQVESLDVDDRRVLEVASAAGLEFSVAVVAAALHDDGLGGVAEVEARCERLADRTALLSDNGTAEWPDGTMTARYGFAHAMYQEVLYGRLRRPTDRAAIHRRIGVRLAEGFDTEAHRIAAELAMHFERGRDFPWAVEYHIQAAEIAAGRSAHREVLFHTGRADELLVNIPRGEERARLELRLRLIEASALTVARGFGSRRAWGAYESARALAQHLGDVRSQIVTLNGLCYQAMGRADLRRATILAEELEGLEQRENDPELKVRVHNLLSPTYWLSGKPIPGYTHAERALKLHDPVAHRQLAVLYGEDQGVVARLNASVAAWLAGLPDTALAHAREVVRLARELGNPSATAATLWHVSVVHQLCGDAEAVAALGRDLEEIAARHDMPWWAGAGKVVHQWAIARLYDPVGALAPMRDGLAGVHPADASLTWPYHAGLLAEVLGLVGDTAAALATVTDALDICRSTGERWYEPELVRLGGEVVWSERPDDAEQALLEAREIARVQQARSFELRAVTSLARLLQRRGEVGRAQAMLTETYQSLTEGYETGDLRAAAALLDEL